MHIQIITPMQRTVVNVIKKNIRKLLGLYPED